MEIPSSGGKPESVQVVVRIRPLSESEMVTETASQSIVNIHSETELELLNADGRRSFQCSYDAVLGEQSSQQELYHRVRSCTASVIEGFNSTVFAYGQTGSGKTYSMYGPPSETGSRVPKDSGQFGVIPRAIHEIFEAAASGQSLDMSVYCSFVQIYNENLYDMLRDANMSIPLSIREDQKEIYVQGLSEYHVKSVKDTLGLLSVAEENRAIRETQMNQLSSRSHSIFQVYVEQKKVAEDGGEVNLRAKYNLVDLAGSEKWQLFSRLKDDHITEMTNINLSLHTLGKCISALVQRSKKENIHVPYRESKLTRLLQDSLGGNAKTFLIATISPARCNCEESISTMKFADRAKQVMVQATINQTRPVDHLLVQRLQREIEHLKRLLAKFNISPMMVTSELPDNATSKEVEGTEDTGESIIDVAEPGFAQETLFQRLQLEEARSRRLENENESLKSELNFLRTTSASTGLSGGSGLDGKLLLQAAREQVGNSTRTYASVQMAAVVPSDSVVIRNNELLEAKNQFQNLRAISQDVWGTLEKLQKIMKRFFKFEIEEDDMKSQVQSEERISQLLGAFLSLRQQQQNQANQLSYQPEYQVVSSSSSISPGKSKLFNAAYQSSSDIRKAAQAEVQSFLQQQHQTQTSSNKINEYPNENSAIRRTTVQTAPPNIPISAVEAKQPVIAGHSRPDNPSGKLPTLAQSNAATQLINRSLRDPMTSDSAMSSPPAAMPARQLLSVDNGGIAGIENPASTVQFRFRGRQPGPNGVSSSNNNNSNNAGSNSKGRNLPESFPSQPSGWIDPSELEEDEEQKLLRQLAAAKKKQKKQQQLQDWLLVKEQRNLEDAQQQEEDKKARKEAELAREAKRKEYAKKQKQKLEEYEKRIKEEALKIQELKDLGIDPSSLSL